MRMRFKPYARGELLASEIFIESPEKQKGNWHSAFKNAQAPLWLELGCGKGGFAARLSAREQGINLMAIDITDKVLVLAKRSIEQEFERRKLTEYNVRIMSCNIERIESILSGEDLIERIYINFCNPWDRKAGHQKHRLTHTRQLMQYTEFLANNGEIWFKCDHDGLFADSVQYFEQAGFEITWQTDDLHSAEPPWNIRTEHEELFAEKGIKIKALIARPRP